MHTQMRNKTPSDGETMDTRNLGEVECGSDCLCLHGISIDYKTKNLAQFGVLMGFVLYYKPYNYVIGCSYFPMGFYYVFSRFTQCDENCLILL